MSAADRRDRPVGVATRRRDAGGTGADEQPARREAARAPQPVVVHARRRTGSSSWLTGPRALLPDGWPFAVWAVVSALYGVTLTMRFGLYDDYRNAGADDLLRFDVGDGRPLAALVHAFQFHHADRFSEFVWIRAVTVALLGLCAACLCSLLRRTGLTALAAAALSVCAAMTVSTQIIAGWGVTLVVAPVALLLGGAGGHLAWRATALVTGGATGRSRGLVELALGGGGLVAALCFYQPAAMAFWLTVLVAQATEELQARQRIVRTLWLGLAAGASMATYLVIWKLGAALTDRGGARGQLSTDPVDKLRWFWDAALRRAFDPFSLSGTTSGWIVVAVALAGFAGIALRQRGTADRLLAPLACAGCFPLAYLPNLATSESWASSRSLAVLMPMAVVLVGLGAHGLLHAAVGRLATTDRILGAALTAVAVVVSLRAEANVQRNLVVSNAVELAAFEAAVREAAAREPAEIVLVPAEWSDSIAAQLSFDEFGYPATAAAWALVPMARSAVRTTGYGGTFRVIGRGELAAVPAGSVVVDAKVVLAGIER